GTADHLGFKLIALVPAAVQHGLGLGLAASAAMLALASTLDILLVFLIARRAGADGVEALGAAFAMACSNAMFYWSRHLMPYDLAMAFALAALLAGLRPGARGAGFLPAGALGFAAFATYNGYWALVAIAFALHVAVALPDVRAGIGRAAALAAGFVLAAAAAVLAVRALAGADAIASWRGFAGTVHQGNFDDGHGIVLGYLWEAERALALLWGLALVALPVAALAGLRADRRAWWWLACALGVFAILVAGSNLAGQFVVYGRLVRQAIPFLSLLLAWVLFGPWRRRVSARWPVPAAAVALAAIAATNFAAPLRLTFPAEFVARGQAIVAAQGEIPHAADAATGRYRFVNAKFMWPMPEDAALPGGARGLLPAPPPRAVAPTQLEGFDRKQRPAYPEADLAMRLVVIE
ncbi:MAG: hypothetical protein KJ018_21315, partial [Burkholderiales bacterium]|nr:hypothetical protein [Burkholderiales bacterium]